MLERLVQQTPDRDVFTDALVHAYEARLQVRLHFFKHFSKTLFRLFVVTIIMHCYSFITSVS